MQTAQAAVVCRNLLELLLETLVTGSEILLETCAPCQTKLGIDPWLCYKSLIPIHPLYRTESYCSGHYFLCQLFCCCWIDLWMKLAEYCGPAVLWPCAFLSSLLSPCNKCAGNTWWVCFCCFVLWRKPNVCLKAVSYVAEGCAPFILSIVLKYSLTVTNCLFHQRTYQRSSKC